MQIKAADDKQPDIDALNALLARPNLDAATRRRIETELRKVMAGAKGERDAAYEIEFHLGSRPNWVTIHDLRLEVGGRVAQIDHLIIDRLVTIWVCESKHFTDGAAVVEFGEWVGFSGRRPYGIGSPIEQNRKHMAVLGDVFAKRLVEPPKGLGFIPMNPSLRSLVLVSKAAQIKRPTTKAGRAKVDGLDEVIKVDQLVHALEAHTEARPVRDVTRAVSSETIERLARELVALHKPATTAWAARFGLPAEQPSIQPNPTETTTRPKCASCGRPVSERVVQYCREQPARFDGPILCYDCQHMGPRNSHRLEPRGDIAGMHEG